MRYESSDEVMTAILIVGYPLVRTVMLGIMGFFPTKAEGAIGGIDYQPDERKKLARS
jgi:hypothetical protein